MYENIEYEFCWFYCKIEGKAINPETFKTRTKVVHKKVSNGCN